MIITILINNLMIMTINNLMMKTMIRDEDLADALLWHLSQSDHFGGSTFTIIIVKLLATFN